MIKSFKNFIFQFKLGKFKYDYIKLFCYNNILSELNIKHYILLKTNKINLYLIELIIEKLY